MPPSETHSAPVGFAGIAPSTKLPARCPACQLQLCKGRDERPHKALMETTHDAVRSDVAYSCQTCKAVLIRTADLAKPGWSQAR
jgi:uncharacterized protein with PIN domain